MANRSGRNSDAHTNVAAQIPLGQTESRPVVQSQALTQSANVIEALVALIEQTQQKLQLDEIGRLTSASQRILELSQQLGTTLALNSCAAPTPNTSKPGRTSSTKSESTGHKPCLELVPHILSRSEAPQAHLNLFPAEPDVVYKPKEKLVLVAEDNAINQKVALWQLRELGFAVDIAANGHDAVRAICESEYAIIFMDCDMPVQNGFEATRAIREREKGGESRIPIVAMTAHATEADRLRCLAVGMDDYLSKPVRAEDLKRVLREHLPEFVHRGGEPLAFEMLEQNLGSEASLEILNVYVRSTAELVVEIQEGIRKQSHETVSAALNELNSSCTVVGASGVVQQCNRMLQYLQKTDWKRLDGSMAELVRETRTVGQYVSELLSKPAGGHI